MPLYHASGGKLIYQSFRNDLDVPACGARLPPGRRLKKRQALAEHATQRPFLKNFTCDVERFRLAPARDFLNVPADGKTYYELRGLGMTRPEWEQSAAEILSQFRETLK